MTILHVAFAMLVLAIVLGLGIAYLDTTDEYGLIGSVPQGNGEEF